VKEVKMERICISESAEQTKDIARKLAETLRGDEVIALLGGLGAGKTVFAKGVALGLDVKEEVKSPTFNIVREYSGRFPFYHFDVYRLSGEDDALGIGFEDYLGRGVVLVEWAGIVAGLLPEGTIYVNMNTLSGDCREIKISKN
jgi:tRNA threonylcarbamoyladenosine biosynthesis protein TsaE